MHRPGAVGCCVAMLALQQVAFDFCDQKWEVGLRKAQTWRNNAVVLDARMNMLVMRVGALQLRDMWMGLRIIPIAQFVILPDFVTVVDNLDCIERQDLFAHDKPDALPQIDDSLDSRNCVSMPDKHEG